VRTARNYSQPLSSHFIYSFTARTRKSAIRARKSMQEEREQRGRQLQRREELLNEVDIDGDVRILATDGANLRGLGFAIRDHGQHDVDDEVDVDGEDEAVFGIAQFTEGDVLNPLENGREEDEVNIDDEADTDATGSGSSGGPGTRTLNELVADGEVIKVADANSIREVRREMEEVMGVAETEELNRAIERARKSGDVSALVEALEKKLSVVESTKISSSTSLLCRICIDPYIEPTVSTGCWHTCCRECWLRCLGSTRLCPICKRITAAADLRRVYL